jgi:tRNA(fMet)-specific endonuclease VapC
MTGLEILFDTNAVIALMEDPAAVASALPSGVCLAVSLFSVGELQFGVHHSVRVMENQARLDRALTRFRLVLPDIRTTHAYAEVRSYLKRIGRPIPANDVWIAAIAVQHGLPLLTRDGHFREVQSLEVRTW